MACIHEGFVAIVFGSAILNPLRADLLPILLSCWIYRFAC